jgi:hypothetical protein
LKNFLCSGHSELNQQHVIAAVKEQALHGYDRVQSITPQHPGSSDIVYSYKPPKLFVNNLMNAYMLTDILT